MGRFKKKKNIFWQIWDNRPTHTSVDAMMKIETKNHAGDKKYPIKAIHILKTHGLSSKDSTLVDGYAIEATRSS